MSRPSRGRITPHGASLADKFWDKVRRAGEGECWLWQAAVNRRGYGVIGHEGKMVGAHRISYFLAFGPIPRGLHVLHECDVPACVNPAHLRLGSNRDNIIDRLRKGRGTAGLTDEIVIAIRDSPDSPSVLAARYGVTRGTICRVRRGYTWSHLPSAPGSYKKFHATRAHLCVKDDASASLSPTRSEEEA